MGRIGLLGLQKLPSQLLELVFKCAMFYLQRREAGGLFYRSLFCSFTVLTCELQLLFKRVALLPQCCQLGVTLG
ncbi:hypothetical protein D3C79_907400 [compost metagenome]